MTRVYLENGHYNSVCVVTETCLYLAKIWTIPIETGFFEAQSTRNGIYVCVLSAG